MSQIELTRLGCRFLLTSGFVLLLTATTFGYTVVMRGGKRIEIPEHFKVTRTTLTYEVFAGINITLQTSAIDFAATEKANHELPGSLLRRAELGASPVVVGTKPAAKAVRTLTDRDLEPYKRARRESEAAYERRRIELGLPSLEESRRRAARESEEFEQEMAERRALEGEAEDYWRSRAGELQSEIAATEAEIVTVRTRLFEAPPLFLSSESYGGIGGGAFSLASPGFGPVINRPFNRNGASFGGGWSSGDCLTGRFGSGGAMNAPSWHRFRTGGPGFPFPGSGGSAVLVAPFLSGDLGQRRIELEAWLDQLVANRAGLQARFRLLEEEARRAGVPPGWLRP